ncbi:hypothetical protein AWC38_SpisGene7540 [Stylophora pistillata]|uniref:Uncharacterized protein n=1 Tax=Stylophora pistillata TaxID=50429 RepID=A0A2B4SH33_STYPI|nr:hypothetical protein AWC38_SpisGene7540 [Stylophora pistillata]
MPSDSNDSFESDSSESSIDFEESRRNQPETESALKEFLEKYLPLRRRTVREETTKDNAGASPPAVQPTQQDSTKVNFGPGNDFISGDQPVGFSRDKCTVQATSEGGNVTDATFVDDCIVEVAVAEVRTYADKV